MSHPFERLQKHIIMKKALTFRDFVERAIVFGGIPALILSLIFWSLAVIFAQAKPLLMIMAVMITLLLTMIGLVLLIRYVDRAASTIRMYQADPSSEDSEKLLMFTIWEIVLSIYLAAFICICLFKISTLGIEHDLLLVAELLLVGYQTWRLFQEHQ